MRSLLFVPGDSQRKQDKAVDAGADVLILDLEDSVALSAKDEARKLTRAFVERNRGSGPKLASASTIFHGSPTPTWRPSCPPRPMASCCPAPTMRTM